MFSVNTRLTGIGAVFKDHEVEALYVLEQAGPLFIGTREIMETANMRLKAQNLSVLSRATYINFVRALAEADLIETESGTGKGGKRDNYRLRVGGLKAFYAAVALTIMRSVIEAFPTVDFGDVINELEIG